VPRYWPGWKICIAEPAMMMVADRSTPSVFCDTKTATVRLPVPLAGESEIHGTATDDVHAQLAVTPTNPELASGVKKNSAGLLSVPVQDELWHTPPWQVPPVHPVPSGTAVQPLPHALSC